MAGEQLMLIAFAILGIILTGTVCCLVIPQIIRFEKLVASGYQEWLQRGN